MEKELFIKMVEMLFTQYNCTSNSKEIYNRLANLLVLSRECQKINVGKRRSFYCPNVFSPLYVTQRNPSSSFFSSQIPDIIAPAKQTFSYNLHQLIVTIIKNEMAVPKKYSLRIFLSLPPSAVCENLLVLLPCQLSQQLTVFLAGLVF